MVGPHWQAHALGVPAATRGPQCAPSPNFFRSFLSWPKPSTSRHPRSWNGLWIMQTTRPMSRARRCRQAGLGEILSADRSWPRPCALCPPTQCLPLSSTLAGLLLSQPGAVCNKAAGGSGGHSLLQQGPGVSGRGQSNRSSLPSGCTHSSSNTPAWHAEKGGHKTSPPYSHPLTGHRSHRSHAHALARSLHFPPLYPYRVDPACAKALFRRAAALALVGEYASAREDLQAAVNIDASLEPDAKRETARLASQEKAQAAKQRKGFGRFFK